MSAERRAETGEIALTNVIVSLTGNDPLLPTPLVSEYKGGFQDGLRGDWNPQIRDIRHLLPTPACVTPASSLEAQEHQRAIRNSPGLDSITDWGPYTPAIRRWETVTRPAPEPTENTGKGGTPRLSVRLVEWMMGLSEGWVTGVPGISWAVGLKLLGNGVVPQQATAAIADCLSVFDRLDKENNG